MVWKLYHSIIKVYLTFRKLIYVEEIWPPSICAIIFWAPASPQVFLTDMHKNAICSMAPVLSFWRLNHFCTLFKAVWIPASIVKFRPVLTSSSIFHKQFIGPLIFRFYIKNVMNEYWCETKLIIEKKMFKSKYNNLNLFSTCITTCCRFSWNCQDFWPCKEIESNFYLFICYFIQIHYHPTCITIYDIIKAIYFGRIHPGKTGKIDYSHNPCHILEIRKHM